MGMQYNFENMEALARFFEARAAHNRKVASENYDHRKGRRHYEDLNAEANVYDFVVDVIRSSNLATAKVAYNDEGLRGAASLLELTIGHAGNLSRLLAELEQSARDKLKNLREREGEALEG